MDSKRDREHFVSGNSQNNEPEEEQGNVAPQQAPGIQNRVILKAKRRLTGGIVMEYKSNDLDSAANSERNTSSEVSTNDVFFPRYNLRSSTTIKDVITKKISKGFTKQSNLKPASGSKTQMDALHSSEVPKHDAFGPRDYSGSPITLHNVIKWSMSGGFAKTSNFESASGFETPMEAHSSKDLTKDTFYSGDNLGLATTIQDVITKSISKDFAKQSNLKSESCSKISMDSPYSSEGTKNDVFGSGDYSGSSTTLQDVMTRSRSEDVENPSNFESASGFETPREAPHSSKDPTNDTFCSGDNLGSSTTIQDVITQSISKDFAKQSNLPSASCSKTSMDSPYSSEVPKYDAFGSGDYSGSSTTLQDLMTWSMSEDFAKPPNFESVSGFETPMQAPHSSKDPTNDTFRSEDYLGSANDTKDFVTQRIPEDCVKPSNFEPANGLETPMESFSKSIATSGDNAKSYESSTTSSTDSMVKWFHEAHDIGIIDHLKKLNESVLQWMQLHMEGNASYDFTPVFDDYKKHLALLKEKFSKRILTTLLNTETGMFTLDNGELFTFGEKFVPSRS